MRYVDLWNNMKMKSVVAIAVFLETVSAISLGLVNTEGGLVRGENIPLASGRHMDVFKGIPFADILEYTQFSGQELADRGNVIVVSIGYRVGSLGFLSTGEPELAESHLPERCGRQPKDHQQGPPPVNCSTDERMASCLKEIDPLFLNAADIDFIAGVKHGRNIFTSIDIPRINIELEDVEKLLAAFIKDKGDAALQAALSLYNSTWEPTPSQESLKKTLVDIETDFLFLASTQAALKLHADNAKTGRTYSYLFSEPNQMAGIIRRYPSWMGADNADDVPYVFGKPFTAHAVFSQKPPGPLWLHDRLLDKLRQNRKFVELNSKMDESYVGENMRMRYMKMKSVVAIAVFLETVSAISLGLVNTEGGLVRGENIPLASGRHMDVFKGIPFADILEYTQFSGQELADRGNVIVVSIGYRVGSLGFLSTGEPELAGGAISQSGVAVSPWTINKDPRQYAVEVALKVNCSTDERMASCLKEIDPVVLTLAGSFNLSSSASARMWRSFWLRSLRIRATLLCRLHFHITQPGNQRPARRLKKTLVDIETDFLFLASTQAALKLHADNAKTGRTYSYLFSEPNQMAGIIRRYPSWMGADNTDDVPYVFGKPFPHPASHQDLSGYMIAYWTNFARTGTGQKFVELNSKMDESYVGENMRMRYMKSLVAIAVFLETVSAISLGLVNTEGGLVRGKNIPLASGRHMDVFKGIPFADPNQMAGIIRRYPSWMGADNADDVPYVFGKPFTARVLYLAKSHRDLSGYMIAYWTNFARTGDPNEGELSVPATWPSFNSTGQKFVELNSKMDESYILQYTQFSGQELADRGNVIVVSIGYRVALKVNCSTDERMASCLKEIDPAVLTLAGSFNLEEVEKLLAAYTKDKGDAALQAALSLYNSTWEPTPSQESLKKTLVHIETDFLFLASTQAALKLHADNAKTGRTYSYLFSEPSQMAGIFRPFPQWMGADHTDDVPYVFGKPFTASVMYLASHQDLSGYMIAYWTNFARTGRTERPCYWPSFNSTGQKFVELNSKMDESYVGENMRMRYVDLWNNLGLVNTEGGLVRGENIPLASGRHMDVFKGIPFADDICLQVYVDLNTTAGSTDCLYLNIWFAKFSGQELADRGNVIVVSTGYRQAAIAWVHRNIRKFGGDPDNITIFGEAISQSGVALSPWTISKDPRLFAVEDLEKLLAAFIKDKGDAALQAALSLYNSTWEQTTSLESIKKTLVDIETDFLFLASTQAALKLHADNAKTGRTYSYLFSEPNQMAGIIRPYPSWMGFENLDGVPYLFGKPFTAPVLYLAESHPDLTSYMIAYWTNFARTGDPNEGELSVPATWPSFNSTGQKFVELNSKMNESYVGENMRMRYVDLWTNGIPSLRTIIPNIIPE
ncbi:hypothetical protein F7725_015174 [Dissostichus mawsoni]|uniref:Carboxylesterase type B domain-containing protein n=1 Tax=Dissostichus mawsoni TaxID=36200 RepID=A0A7J5YJL7_DISMA|nr:hypothetical protein F7725_015174 [Dissostichus mawsoni]